VYRIVVAHYVFSALCLVALATLLLFSTGDLFGNYFSPHLLAITHLAALGWGTSVIFGACYQLIPVVFETKLFSTKLPWIGFVMLAAGVILLASSFWRFDVGTYMQLAGALIVTAIVLFNATVMLTARQNKKAAAIYQEFISTACIWLFATALLGLLLVLNFRYIFLPKDHLHFLKLHAHMGIAGWFLLLIIGVSSKLIPMFLASRKQNEKLLNWSYYLINAALLAFLVDGYINGINYKTFAIAAAAVAGLVFYAIYIVQCFRSRLKKKIELPITNTLISYGLLAAAVLILPLIIYFHLQNDGRAVLYSNVYGFLIFIGWISSLILGQAFKTLPIIVWTRKYEDLAGRVKTPLPAELYSHSLLKVQTAAYTLFCACFFIGMLLQNSWLTLAGLICLLITSLTYIGNIFVLLSHKSARLK
jgi:hypothetical protein